MDEIIEKYDTKEDDIDFVFERASDYYAIKEYIGNSEIVEIPESYLGLPVREILDEAFLNSKSVKRIKIPNSITYIGNCAFSDCDNLVFNEYDNAYYLGNDNNPYHALIEMKDKSARWCKIHKDTKIIVEFAFVESWLQSIEIPGGITSLEDSLFMNCTFLEEVIIPDSVTKIGNSVFSGCRALKGITIPDSVTSMGEDVFANCETLDRIVISYGVTNIGERVFEGCKNLSTVVIPDSVTSVGDEAFSDCPSLVMREYDNAYYVGNETNPYLVLVRARNDGIKKCEINSETKILYYFAFNDCKKLKSITIPEGVIEIGNAVFRNCEELTNVVIPEGVRHIGGVAFRGCKNLKALNIPNSITSLGENLFDGCDKLVFYKYDNAYYLGNASNPYLVLVKARDKNIDSCEINERTKIICSNTFYGCIKMTSISIPYSVEFIEHLTFYPCKDITIYCEAEERPRGWSDEWNDTGYPVVWGYKG